MRTETRTQFNQFTRRVAELNNIESPKPPQPTTASTTPPASR